MKDPECPNSAKHVEGPDGYCEWFEWVDKKSRRHYQMPCPGCGLYVIWKRRPKDESDYGGTQCLCGAESLSLD